MRCSPSAFELKHVAWLRAVARRVDEGPLDLERVRVHVGEESTRDLFGVLRIGVLEQSRVAVIEQRRWEEVTWITVRE